MFTHDHTEAVDTAWPFPEYECRKLVDGGLRWLKTESLLANARSTVSVPIHGQRTWHQNHFDIIWIANARNHLAQRSYRRCTSETGGETDRDT